MTARQVCVAVALAIAAIVFLLVWVVPAFVYHPIGYCVGPPAQVRACRGYGFWSGIAGSFLTSLLTGSGMWTGMFMWWWHSRCDTPRCLRKGKYKTADGHHKQCRVCHPDLPDHKPTRDEIHRMHHAAKEQR